MDCIHLVTIYFCLHPLYKIYLLQLLPRWKQSLRSRGQKVELHPNTHSILCQASSFGAKLAAGCNINNKLATVNSDFTSCPCLVPSCSALLSLPCSGVWFVNHGSLFGLLISYSPFLFYAHIDHITFECLKLGKNSCITNKSLHTKLAGDAFCPWILLEYSSNHCSTNPHQSTKGLTVNPRKVNFRPITSQPSFSSFSFILTIVHSFYLILSYNWTKTSTTI